MSSSLKWYVFVLLIQIFYMGHFMSIYANIQVDTPRGVDLSLFFNISCALQYFVVLQFYHNSGAAALVTVVAVMQLLSGISVVVMY